MAWQCAAEVMAPLGQHLDIPTKGMAVGTRETVLVVVWFYAAGPLGSDGNTYVCRQWNPAGETSPTAPSVVQRVNDLFAPAAGVVREIGFRPHTLGVYASALGELMRNRTEISRPELPEGGEMVESFARLGGRLTVEVPSLAEAVQSKIYA